jgi:hypothetical protein
MKQENSDNQTVSQSTSDKQVYIRRHPDHKWKGDSNGTLVGVE